MRSAPIASALAVYSGVSKLTCTWLLRGQIIDFRRAENFLHQADQIGGIGDIAVMADKSRARCHAGHDKGDPRGPC